MGRAASCLGLQGSEARQAPESWPQMFTGRCRTSSSHGEEWAGGSPAPWASEAEEGLGGIPHVCLDRAGQGFLSDLGPPGRGQVVLRTNHLTKWQLLTSSPQSMASILETTPGIA